METTPWLRVKKSRRPSWAPEGGGGGGGDIQTLVFCITQEPPNYGGAGVYTAILEVGTQSQYGVYSSRVRLQ